MKRILEFCKESFLRHEWSKIGFIDVGDGCWRRNVLVTVLAILVTNIHYLFTLASGTNIQKMSLTSTNRHQL